MKKVFLSIFSLSILSGGLVYSQNYVNENFNNVSGGALPVNWSASAEWSTGAPDATVPHAVVGLGISMNTPSHMNVVGVDGDISADNTILATPTFSLPASATATKLVYDVSYFKAQLSSNAAKKETLTLVVSTNGGSTWSDISEVDAVSSSIVWETRTVNLGTYAGQSNLKIGFRYNNTATRLVGAAFDNVRIYVQTANDIAMTGASPVAGSPQSYKDVGSSATISGTVFNYGNVAINSYTVYYKQGTNAAVSYTVTGANIAPLTSGSFTHGTPFTVPAAADYPFDVWVEMTGDTYHNDDSAKAMVSGVAFLPVKKLVFEEATGTWCVWCPRGSVKMEEFAASHPGTVSQIAVHNNDPMAISNYDGFINSFISGYPSIVMDRSLVDDPGNVLPLYAANKDNFGYATVDLGNVAVSGTSVTAPVTITPAVSIEGAKLALVITESNVTGTGPGWKQKNIYAGGSKGPMGGYENQPSEVGGVNYHFVARSITPSAGGDASGLPATMAAGTPYTANLTATLNPGWKAADLQYIVLLIGADGRVLNSDFSDLPNLNPGLPTAIANVEAGIDEAYIYPNPTTGLSYLTLNSKDAASATISITDVMGRSVASEVSAQLIIGKNTISIPTATLANGFYMVSMNTKKGTLVFKLQVVK